MSSPDTTLVLGTFIFRNLEIPTDITGLGNSQSIGIHKLVGGGRTLDAMGVDYPPISWGGLFFGEGALDRVNSLKAMTAAGLPLTLTWHTFSYAVVIRSFEPDERRQYEIPYRITCEVISDNSSPLNYLAAPTVDINDAMSQGLTAAQIKAAVVNDTTLNLAMTALANSIAQVEDFASAAASTIGLVQLAVANAKSRVGLLLTLTDATLGAMAGFAGIGVGIDAQTMAANLAATQAAITDETNLLLLNGTLGIMASNLANATSSPNTLAVVGGNLFSIAAQQYGDASEWTVIAGANGIVDPFLTGPQTLTIPLNPSDNGGVLSS